MYVNMCTDVPEAMYLQDKKYCSGTEYIQPEDAVIANGSIHLNVKSYSPVLKIAGRDRKAVSYRFQISFITGFPAKLATTRFHLKVALWPKSLSFGINGKCMIFDK